MAVGPPGCGDRVRAGQAAAVGGPQVVMNRVIHSFSRCQPSGRCSVICRRGKPGHRGDGLGGALVANLIAIGVAWHQLQAAQRGHVLAASD